MIEFRISSDEGQIVAVASRLQAVGAATADMRPYWPEALVEVRDILGKSFESEGTSGQAGHWASLSPKYAKWKSHRFPGAKILERTGRLKASLAGTTDQSVEETATRLTLTSLVPYGGFHQQGIGQKKRSPWSPTNADANRIVSAITRALRRSIGTAA